jgi:alkylated DNA repair dioxygenase AlkB
MKIINLPSYLDEDNEKESWIESFKAPENCTEEIFKELLDLKPNKRGSVIIFGKEIDVPRWQLSLGESYRFSGKLHESQGPIDIHPFIEKLRLFCNSDSGQDYKQCLINYYLTGTEYIGQHSDSEVELKKDAPIYSFSFGSIRDFVVKSKVDDFRIVIPMKHNTCLKMCGKMQKYFKHSVPVRKRVAGPRINITFRVYN